MPQRLGKHNTKTAVKTERTAKIFRKNTPQSAIKIDLDVPAKFCDTPPPKTWGVGQLVRAVTMSNHFFSFAKHFHTKFSSMGHIAARLNWKPYYSLFMAPALAAALFVALPGCKHVETADEVSSKAKATEAAKAEKEASQSLKHNGATGDSIFMSDEAQQISRHFDR